MRGFRFPIWDLINPKTEEEINATLPEEEPETKLVRDKIPEIVGKSCIYWCDWKMDALVGKLHEEAEELLACVDKEDIYEELADIYEVLEAIHYHYNLDEVKTFKLQQQKREERGGFDKLRFMEIE